MCAEFHCISVFIPQHVSLELLDPGNVMLINHISNTGIWLDEIYSSDIEEEQFYYRAPAIWPDIYKTYHKLKYFQNYHLNMSSNWIGMLTMNNFEQNTCTNVTAIIYTVLGLSKWNTCQSTSLFLLCNFSLTSSPALYDSDVFNRCHPKNISKVNVTLLYLVTLTSESINDKSMYQS